MITKALKILNLNLEYKSFRLFIKSHKRIPSSLRYNYISKSLANLELDAMPALFQTRLTSAEYNDVIFTLTHSVQFEFSLYKHYGIVKPHNVRNIRTRQAIHILRIARLLEKK